MRNPTSPSTTESPSCSSIWSASRRATRADIGIPSADLSEKRLCTGSPCWSRTTRRSRREARPPEFDIVDQRRMELVASGDEQHVKQSVVERRRGAASFTVSSPSQYSVTAPISAESRCSPTIASSPGMSVPHQRLGAPSALKTSPFRRGDPAGLRRPRRPGRVRRRPRRSVAAQLGTACTIAAMGPIGRTSRRSRNSTGTRPASASGSPTSLRT